MKYCTYINKFFILGTLLKFYALIWMPILGIQTYCKIKLTDYIFIWPCYNVTLPVFKQNTYFLLLFSQKKSVRLENLKLYGSYQHHTWRWNSSNKVSMKCIIMVTIGAFQMNMTRIHLQESYKRPFLQSPCCICSFYIHTHTFFPYKQCHLSKYSKGTGCVHWPNFSQC